MQIKTIKNYSVSIPDDQLVEPSQDQEYCIIRDHRNNNRMEVGFHEYEKIYSIPGLYEYLFYGLLKCSSPQKICELLIGSINRNPDELNGLCVLDLGAGNGVVGEQLQKRGVHKIYGIDIIPEAKAAAKRDRPDVYRKYYLANLTQLSPLVKEELITKKFNCMTSAGSLGFGDVSVKAFKESLNLLSNDAWVVFSIQSGFLSNNDCSGFSAFFQQIIDLNIFRVLKQESYCHRLSAKGKPIYYTAVVGKKQKDALDILRK